LQKLQKLALVITDHKSFLDFSRNCDKITQCGFPKNRYAIQKGIPRFMTLERSHSYTFLIVFSWFRIVAK